MKTVVKELLEYFEQQLRLHRSSEIKYTTEEAWVDAINIYKNALKTKEAEQIKAAFNQGYREGFDDAESDVGSDKDVREFDDAKNYYNETFKND